MLIFRLFGLATTKWLCTRIQKWEKGWEVGEGSCLLPLLCCVSLTPQAPHTHTHITHPPRTGMSESYLKAVGGRLKIGGKEVDM